MWNFVIFTTILKSFTPYFRKHILGTLNSDEFLLLNSLIILSLVLIYFLFKIIFGKQRETLGQIINNYKKMKYSQIFCVAIISLLTVASSLFIYELDKNHNTPLINNVLLRIFSVIALIIVGIFIFKEEYNWKQIVGIFLAIIGVILIMQKSKKSN